jgi:hypothetical protein
MAYNEIRVISKGKDRQVEVRPLRPEIEKKVEEPLIEPLSEELESYIARVSKLFGLGSYGDRLARELLEEVYSLGWDDCRNF